MPLLDSWYLAVKPLSLAPPHGDYHPWSPDLDVAFHEHAIQSYVEHASSVHHLLPSFQVMLHSVSCHSSSSTQFETNPPIGKTRMHCAATISSVAIALR